MNRGFRLLSVALIGFAFLFRLGLVAAQDDKKDPQKDKRTESKEPKTLGKTIGEWIKILRSDENPKMRRAALLPIEVSGAVRTTALPAVLDAIEKDKEPAVRLAAVNLLGKMGPEIKPSLKALVAALQSDKSDEVREAAASHIANRFIKEVPEYIDVLIVALKDPHPGTRVAVATALRNLGKEAAPAIPALLAAAENPKEHPLVRGAALHVLSRHAKENPKTQPLLVSLLKGVDNPPALREAAVEGLGLSKSGAPEVVAALATALTDKSLEMRKSAAVALGALGAKASAGWPTIKSRLQEKNEPDSAVRNHLVRLAGALAKTNAEAVPAMVEVAVSDNSTENRIAALQELGELGPTAKGAAASISKIATEDARATVREAAAKALTLINAK